MPGLIPPPFGQIKNGCAPYLSPFHEQSPFWVPLWYNTFLMATQPSCCEKEPATERAQTTMPRWVHPDRNGRFSLGCLWWLFAAVPALASSGGTLAQPSAHDRLTGVVAVKARLRTPPSANGSLTF
jgi:hypothetical protein